jgi:hypothetical protein
LAWKKEPPIRASGDLLCWAISPSRRGAFVQCAQSGAAHACSTQIHPNTYGLITIRLQPKKALPGTVKSECGHHERVFVWSTLFCRTERRGIVG